MLIEVKETHPPGAGKKMAAVIAAGGQRYEIYPDKLGGIRVGQSYDVEVEDREYQGRTFRKIVKATPVNGAARPASNGNGAAKPAGGTPVAAGPVSTTEVAFVRDALAAAIAKGDVPFTHHAVLDATLMLRGVFRTAFIGGGIDG